MKVKYDRDADILIFVLQENPPANAISAPGEIIVSYSEDEQPISIEFLNASKRQLFNPEEMNITIHS